MTTPERAALLRAFRDGLAALDPARLVEAALPPRPSGRAALLAVGKAARAMARGALNAWPDVLCDGLVICADADDGGPLPSPLRVLSAAHPLPDARSVAAADAALELAARLGPGDLLLALLSGGASALLSAPPPGVSLDDKRALVAALLDAGAPIQDINLIRRHASRVKGGRLAAAAAPARVVTLLLSDVVGGLPHDIGSGPTVPDPTRVAEAVAALRRWAPRFEHLVPLLTESVKPSPALRADARILADPAALAEQVAAALATHAGLRAAAAPPERGDARAIVARRLALARALAPGEAAVIPCEPTLPLPAQRGAGGRAGWIALAAARDLPDDVALLCAASDGVDGSSGAAGAVVTRAAADAAPPGTIDAALAAFDDAPLHRALGTQIEGGPTGHNLTDLHIVARAHPTSRATSAPT